MDGREDAETVWALAHIADIAVQASAVSADEAKRWLQRLDWEGDENFFGSLTFYIARGTKPASGESETARL